MVAVGLVENDATGTWRPGTRAGRRWGDGAYPFGEARHWLVRWSGVHPPHRWHARHERRELRESPAGRV